MVKHIVMWNFNENLSVEERKEAGQRIKDLLEAIKDQMEGAVSIKVEINEMGSSNRDIALVSTFTDEQALKTYQKHPAHVEAGKFVRSVTCDRACMDFEVSDN